MNKPLSYREFDEKLQEIPSYTRKRQKKNLFSKMWSASLAIGSEFLYKSKFN